MFDTRMTVEIMSEINRLRAMCVKYKKLAKGDLCKSNLLFAENKLEKLVKDLQVLVNNKIEVECGVKFDKCEIGDYRKIEEDI